MVHTMLVYVSPKNLRRGAKIFHKDLDCRQLTKASNGGVKHEPLVMELDELARPRPCRTCYPDAPQLRSVHRVCFICNTDRGPRACPHNGGIAIPRERAYGRPGVHHDPEDTQSVVVYVWPEHLHLYVS